MNIKIEKIKNMNEKLIKMHGILFYITVITFILPIWIGVLGIKLFLTNFIILIVIELIMNNVKKNLNKLINDSDKEKALQKACEVLADICDDIDYCICECPFINEDVDCHTQCDKKEEWYRLLKGEN